MKTKLKQSPYLSLGQRDFIRGITLAVIMEFITLLIVTLEDGNWPSMEELRNCTLASLSAGLSYLVKNFFTKPDAPTNSFTKNK